MHLCRAVRQKHAAAWQKLQLQQLRRAVYTLTPLDTPHAVKLDMLTDKLTGKNAGKEYAATSAVPVGIDIISSGQSTTQTKLCLLEPADKADCMCHAMAQTRSSPKKHAFDVILTDCMCLGCFHLLYLRRADDDHTQRKCVELHARHQVKQVMIVCEFYTLAAGTIQRSSAPASTLDAASVPASIFERTTVMSLSPTPPNASERKR